MFVECRYWVNDAVLPYLTNFEFGSQKRRPFILISFLVSFSLSTKMWGWNVSTIESRAELDSLYFWYKVTVRLHEVLSHEVNFCFNVTWQQGSRTGHVSCEERLYKNALRQCFSAAGPRPRTGSWHQLYRAARDSLGICHFSFLSIFHEQIFYSENILECVEKLRPGKPKWHLCSKCQWPRFH